MRIKTVGDLKAALEDFPDEQPVMAVHQMRWPLREVIGGLYLEDSEYDEEKHICPECDRVTLGEPYESNDGDWLRKCFRKECGYEVAVEPPSKEEEKVLYVVLSGHPYEGSPYGPRQAWDNL